jgi:hypothetical protein
MHLESRQELKQLHRYLGGIAHSNGEMAEEYFYNAFKADKTFANEKFYEIERNLAFKSNEKKAEFDIVLLLTSTLLKIRFCNYFRKSLL